MASYPFALLSSLPPTLHMLKLSFFTNDTWWDVLDIWLNNLTGGNENYDDKLLAHIDQLPHLKEVRFVNQVPAKQPLDSLREHEIGEEAKDGVRRAFPKVWQRGLLSFQTGPC